MDYNKAIDEAKKVSGEKKFTQTIDLIVSLKDFDIKRTAKIEDFILLPHGKGRDNKICALIGPELKDQAEKNADKAILTEHFGNWKDKRKTKNLVRTFDFFIAQATIMPQIAQTFGKYFGPLGKMPNPKAGSVVPPTANILPLIERLKKTVKITISKSPVVQCAIGNEKMDTKDIAENAITVIGALEAKLPRGKHQVGKIFIKTTMGKPVRLN